MVLPLISFLELEDAIEEFEVLGFLGFGNENDELAQIHTERKKV